MNSTDFYCTLHSYLWLHVQSACVVGLLWFNSAKLLFRVCVTFELKYQTKPTDNRAHRDLDIYMLVLWDSEDLIYPLTSKSPTQSF